MPFMPYHGGCWLAAMTGRACLEVEAYAAKRHVQLGDTQHVAVNGWSAQGQ